MWEKYSSEIGTQNGPLRHVDESAQYPHLNGFVAFDIEHWWAERSISCMINEAPSSNQPSSNKNEEIKTKQTNLTKKNFLDFKKAAGFNNFTHSNSISSPFNQNLNNFQLCLS